jgi:hypothetical protein
MNQEELERYIDDDYNVINHYYKMKRVHPDIPFYLQDENGDTYEFGWSLIYQYIDKLNNGYEITQDTP